MVGRWSVALAGALVAGCGNDGAVSRHDAAVDSPSVDSAPPVDAPIDAPMAVGDHYHYVVDRVYVPTTNTQSREFGLDLNADGTVDNQLGMAMMTLGSMGFDLSGWFDTRIDTGQDILLADITTLDFENAQLAGFTLYQGSNPMPSACDANDSVCRKHLTGSASFTALATHVDPPLVGNFVNATFTAGPGHLTVPFAFPDAPTTWVTLLGARTKVSSANATSIGDSTLSTGGAVLAGCISQADIDGKLLPTIRAGATAAIARDCPGATPPTCICMDNSRGKTFLGLFDTDHDCAVSLNEVRNNSLVSALFTTDLMVENQRCMSFGMKTTAVGASFVAPP